MSRVDRDMHIFYKRSIPDNYVKDFIEEIYSDELIYSIEKENPDVDYFDGPELSNVVLYIEQHYIDWLIGGLTMPLIYDTFKFAMRNLYVAVKAKQKGKNKKETLISIRVREGKRQIKIDFDESIGSEKFNIVVEKAFEHLKPDEKKKLFSNENWVATMYGGNQTVYLQYNKTTGLWEPHDLSQAKKEWDDMIKKMDDHFSS